MWVRDEGYQLENQKALWKATASNFSTDGPPQTVGL